MLIHNLYLILFLIIFSSCEKIIKKDRIEYRDTILTLAYIEYKDTTIYTDTGSVRIEYKIIYKDTCIDKPPIEVIKYETIYQDTGRIDTTYYYEMLAIDTSLTPSQSRGIVISKHKGESDHHFIADSGAYGYYDKVYKWMKAIKFHLDYVNSLKGGRL